MTLRAGTLGVFMMNVVIQSAFTPSVVAPIDSAAKQTKLAKKRERKKINFIPKIFNVTGRDFFNGNVIKFKIQI
jgi:hypothetical protein